MPNKIIFTIGEDTIDVDRIFLERWYLTRNPHDYIYDSLRTEVAKITIKELADLYWDYELSNDDDVQVSYELCKDPDDVDVAEKLMSEVRYAIEQLKWMLPEKDLQNFIEGLLRREEDD